MIDISFDASLLDELTPCSLDVIVIAGCGRLRPQTVEKLSGKSGRFIFLEADSTLKESNLSVLSESDLQFSYHTAAIGEESISATFYRFNFSRFNGFNNYCSYPDYPPNLKLQSQEDVQLFNLQSIFVLESISPGVQRIGLVVLEAKDGSPLFLPAELEIFAHLIKSPSRSSDFQRRREMDGWGYRFMWRQTSVVGQSCIDWYESNRLSRAFADQVRKDEPLEAETVSEESVRLQLSQSEERFASLKQQYDDLLLAHSEQTRGAQHDLESAQHSLLSFQAELQNLTQALDEARDRNTLLEQSIHQEKIAKADLYSQLEQSQRSLIDAEQRTKQLAVNFEAAERVQQSMNEELIRGEAQIELIKDLLLRESDRI